MGNCISTAALFELDRSPPPVLCAQAVPKGHLWVEFTENVRLEDAILGGACWTGLVGCILLIRRQVQDTCCLEACVRISACLRSSSLIDWGRGDLHQGIQVSVQTRNVRSSVPK